MEKPFEILLYDALMKRAAGQYAYLVKKVGGETGLLEFFGIESLEGRAQIEALVTCVLVSNAWLLGLIVETAEQDRPGLRSLLLQKLKSFGLLDNS